MWLETGLDGRSRGGELIKIERERYSWRWRSVSVVVTKDGVEPLSHKELYKKKTAQHNERQRVGGGEESSEAVAKNSTLGAKLKLKPRTWLC